MEKMIKLEDFLNNLFSLLDETFDNTHGIYLDKDTSLFRTLETVSPMEASIPVGGKCASLAAQVAHVTFYLEVLERYFVAHDTSQADWGAIWRTVEKVTPEEWEEYKANLKRTYRRIVAELRDVTTWESDPHLASALAITVHTAYHLGEIRQALCTIK